MVGVEIDMVVKDCKKALALYQSIFELEVVEATDLRQGQNEAVFTLYGVRFHMLDETPEYGLTAPGPEGQKSMWLNVLVEDINATYGKAIQAGCAEIQPVAQIESHGVSNAVFADGFGYCWMLHQIHRDVSFEDRVEAFQE